MTRVDDEAGGLEERRVAGGGRACCLLVTGAIGGALLVVAGLAVVEGLVLYVLPRVRPGLAVLDAPPPALWAARLGYLGALVFLLNLFLGLFKGNQSAEVSAWVLFLFALSLTPVFF